MHKHRHARIAMMLSIVIAFGAVARSGYAGEAISRAVTVVNGSPPVVFSEANSRAVTVVRPLDPPPLTEAISRAATVVRPLDLPPLTEAISRAVTICDAGDLNASGGIDMGDISLFVAVLLGIDTDPVHVTNCDLNCDTRADGLDIQPFVDALLGG